jgi:hypothetical protein
MGRRPKNKTEVITVPAGEEQNTGDIHQIADPEPSDPVFSEQARLWHNAFIGKTGSGKTYAARGEVEDILDGGGQVVIIDPTGAWSGLRMTPEGKPSNYNIAIFGGEFGDRPLVPDMASALGRIAGTTKRSMILDLSGISLEIEDQREIVHEFLKSLYRINRKPLHLIIDEADEFAPQDLDKETKSLRTTVARIMARGRSLGFRCTLITQRPAKIDKNSISQVESMAVLRVTAPQDRKAIVDWFDDKGGENKHDILSGLGSLATGEGWVFTGVEQTYAHRKFRKIKTYDSSSTPVDKDGKAIRLDKGDLDLADFDNHLSYPGERTEEELEKVITKRRNLEADNLKLRTRLLKAESRYEAMRQAFVGIRTVIDNLLVDNDLEAVEYADLLLLRNEVAEDGKVRVDLNDISGTAGIFMDIPAPVLPEREYNPFPGFGEITEIQPMRPVVFEAPKRDPYDLPQRKMTAVDEQVIWAIRKRDGTDEENRDYVKLTTKNWLNSIERLLKEGTLYRDNEGRLRVGVNADIRDLSENQMETLLKIRDAKEEFHLYEYNHKTISVLTRKGFFKDGLTDKGKEAANFVAEYLSRKASLP